MTSKSTFVSILNSFGFVKMSWDKCPRGFEKANYPCYANESRNIYCELYLGDKIPYGWIISSTLPPRGKFFESPKELQLILKQIDK